MDPAHVLTDAVVTRAIGAALSVVLLAGAWQKLRDRELFQAAVENYQLVPESWHRPVATALPLLELAAGVLLLPAPTRTLGAFLAAVLLLVVTSAVAINLLRGRRDIDCGCGTPGTGQRLSWALVGRNAALLAACVVAAAPEQARELVWLDAFTAVFAALALWTLYAAANQLLADSHRLSSSRMQP